MSGRIAAVAVALMLTACSQAPEQGQGEARSTSRLRVKHMQTPYTPDHHPAERHLSRTIAPQTISTTDEDHFILIELTPDDLIPGNRFDLEQQTIVFTPDGHGRYSRTLSPWAGTFPPPYEQGVVVYDKALVEIESFGFDFADRRWYSFYVSEGGALSFGEPIRTTGTSNDTLHTIVANTFGMPAISPSYDMTRGATMHVTQSPGEGRVTVTWTLDNVRAGDYERFSVDLFADHSIAFHYYAISRSWHRFAGLVLTPEVEKGDPIARLVDARDQEVLGAVDLLEVTIYETNLDDHVVAEFTVRDAIPEEGRYRYSLAFDADEPYWTEPQGPDRDFSWVLERRGGEWKANVGGNAGRVFPSAADNKIALLASLSHWQAVVRSPEADIRRAMAVARTAGPRLPGSNKLNADRSQMTLVEFGTGQHGGIFTSTDLSESDATFSDRQAEVFQVDHLVTDTYSIGCTIVDVLGDTFDALTFYSNELLLDRPLLPASILTGQLCESDRLRGVWAFVNPTYYLHDYWEHPPRDDAFNTYMFTHELTHIWGASANYLNAEDEKIALNDTSSHWLVMLHTAAAFVPDGNSVLGGSIWKERSDGRFESFHYWYHGHSWLDLYTMGLASAHEVPDLLIVHDAMSGEKETVTIDQIIAADGPVGPTAARTLNVGFVYLVRPGDSPDPAQLRTLAAYRDANVKLWSRSTGGRSTLTSVVPVVPQEDGDNK